MAIKTVAVIGLRHGARHVNGFLDAGASKVYAIDLNKKIADQFKDGRVIFSTSYTEAIKNIDAIVISLPPFLHKEALTRAINTSAKRIWIEKPLFDIGEDPVFANDSRVEVIYELRRSQLLQSEINRGISPSEVWLTWKRPVPSVSHTDEIEVIHDLGTHLIDFAKTLAHGALPKVSNVQLERSRTNGAQEVHFDLTFPQFNAHICAAWTTAEEWPDSEIVIKQLFGDGKSATQWIGKKSLHRHLTTDGQVSSEQIAHEKDWYKPALREESTYFSSFEDGIMTHRICNEILTFLEKEGSI